MKTIVTLSVVLFGATSVCAQQASQPKIRAVEIPREVSLVSGAYQPNCPLQFENAKFLAGVEGGGLTAYDLRNRGTKPIGRISIGDSTGSRWSWDVAKEHGPVMPGQLVPPWSAEDWIQTVPLTDELREKLKLRPPMKGVLVLMVIRVEFTDGTVYDDEPVFLALQSYFEHVGSELLRAELNKPCAARYDNMKP